LAATGGLPVKRRVFLRPGRVSDGFLPRQDQTPIVVHLPHTMAAADLRFFRPQGRA
jgi:hypothetical protein